MVRSNGLVFFFSLVLIMAIFLPGCRQSLLERVGWNTDLAIPLAEGRVDIHNLVPDSNTSIQQDDHVWLVYKNKLYELNLAQDYIEIPDTALRQRVSLDSLYLPDRTVLFPVSLGQIAMADNSGLGAVIIGANGSEMAIPAFNNIAANNIPVDATDLFKSASMDEGYMDLRITNGLPLPVTDLEFALKNASSNEVVATDQIAQIDPGQTVMRTYDLSGKTLEGELLVDILNISSPGSGGDEVLIDTSDALELEITVRDLKLNAAEAVFPEQNLVNMQKEVIYDMKGPEFTYLTIRSGKLVITAFNTIEDSLYLNYKIPYAVSEAGQSINEFTTVGPAHNNIATEVNKTIDLSGYSIDLTGVDKRKFNTFYNELTARIDSTGNLVEISLTDSISVYYGLVDIVPEYLEGYIGQEQISIGPNKEALSVFQGFDGGSIDLENVNMVFSVYNGLGMDAFVNVEYLRAKTPAGNELELSAPFLGNELSINRAYQNPMEPGITNIKLDNSNSNIEAIIESQPQSFEYALDLDVNPEGNRLNYQDFVYYNAPFEVSLDMEIPLSLIATNLVLESKAPMKFEEPESDGQLESATITLEVVNSFPVSARSQVYLYDGNQLVDSLFSRKVTIPAADINESTCRTQEPITKKMEVEVASEKLDRLRSAGSYKFHSLVNTSQAPAGCDDHVKIYSDYYIDFRIGSLLNYKIGK